MNEQEAIDHINLMCENCRYWYNGKCHEDGNCFEAMQMSIKALQMQEKLKQSIEGYKRQEFVDMTLTRDGLIDILEEFRLEC